MQVKIKSLLFVFSLLLNGFFILLLAMASFSKNFSLSVYAPESGYITAAAVVSVPKTGRAAFDLIEIAVKPGEKAFLQFAAVSEKKQGSLLINALYDPGVISVTQAGGGIEITALAEGSTLMQALTNEGIKDVALVTVEE